MSTCVLVYLCTHVRVHLLTYIHSHKIPDTEILDTEMQDTTMEADAEAEDSAPEHVPLTKHYKGMPKKEKPKKEVPR